MTAIRAGRFSASFLTAAAAAAFVFGLASRADALTLQLKQGANIATVNGVGGLASFNGVLGNYTINVTTGISYPALGSPAVPHIDLNSVDVAGLAGGILTIMLTDIGFTGTGGLLSFENRIGGTLNPGTLSVQTYMDAGNTPFALTALLTSLSFGSPGAFSGSADGVGLSNASPYSLTEVVTLNFTGSGVASFDSELQETPIPAALPLFASGLGALGLAAYRRKRKALAA